MIDGSKIPKAIRSPSCDHLELILSALLQDFVENAGQGGRRLSDCWMRITGESHSLWQVLFLIFSERCVPHVIRNFVERICKFHDNWVWQGCRIADCLPQLIFSLWCAPHFSLSSCLWLLYQHLRVHILKKELIYHTYNWFLIPQADQLAELLN